MLMRDLNDVPGDLRRLTSVDAAVGHIGTGGAHIAASPFGHRAACESTRSPRMS
jgi:hypothetical protein